MQRQNYHGSQHLLLADEVEVIDNDQEGNDHQAQIMN